MGSWIKLEQLSVDTPPASHDVLDLCLEVRKAFKNIMMDGHLTHTDYQHDQRIPP